MRGVSNKHCLLTFFIESVNSLSTERYLANLYYRTSKLFFGQVHYGNLLVPGQVENFTISTPLNMWSQKSLGLAIKFVI